MVHSAPESTTGSPSSETQVRPWRVLHACEEAAEVSLLVDAQSKVGMRPQVLAREFWNDGAPSAQASLLTAWHSVRDWRHALNEAEALTHIQLVHAHSFAAAMAGVRGALPCVFDLSRTLEQSMAMPDGTGAGPWLTRSFRVAEQFALSRAAAVVTHSLAMQKVAAERGAAAANVFLIPQALETRQLMPDQQWCASNGIAVGHHVPIFVLPSRGSIDPMLEAFSKVVTELENALLLFECDAMDRATLLRRARDLQIADNVRCIGSDEREQAMACADLVVSPATGDSSHPNQMMLRAMAAGKAVVAADVAENRECSFDGRGVIWYRDGDSLDLAQRAAFVARNTDFSRSLGESGLMHVRATRASHVVGKLHDEVYKHAQSRRRDGMPKLHVPQLYALNLQR